MNTIPTELVNEEKNTDGVHEGGEELTELGEISSQTKGTPLGNMMDVGGGLFFA